MWITCGGATLGAAHAPPSSQNCSGQRLWAIGSPGAFLPDSSDCRSVAGIRVSFFLFALPQRLVWTPSHLRPSVPQLHLLLLTASRRRLASHYLNMTKTSVMVHCKLWCILSWRGEKKYRARGEKKKKLVWNETFTRETRFFVRWIKRDMLWGQTWQKALRGAAAFVSPECVTVTHMAKLSSTSAGNLLSLVGGDLFCVLR